MKTATYFECDFCKAHSKSQSYIKGHEKRCYRNPILKACASCRWWFKNNPKFGKSPIDEDLRQDGAGNNYYKPIDFCSNQDHDYSEEVEYIDSYGKIPVGNSTRTGCEGWRAKE